MTLTHHLHQLASHAYQAGELDAGRRASERLLARPLPPDFERIARRNRAWYTRPLHELVATRHHRIDLEPAREGWSLFNPSIVANPGGGYTMAVRSSNYRITPAGYVTNDPDHVIRTETLLVDLDDDLRATAQTTLTADYPKTGYPVDGLEDVRLNRVGDDLVASATIRNLEPLDGTARIATATVNRTAGRFDAIRCPHTPDNAHEKNWMPIEGRPTFLYATNAAGRVATATPDGDHWRIDHHAPSPRAAAGYRGGSQLVDVGNGHHLAIIHEVAVDDDGRRIYEHRFVLYAEADGWAVQKVSPLFYFREHRTIEFCAGLARRGDRLVATFGVRDAEAWATTLDLDELAAILEPPPA